VEFLRPLFHQELDDEGEVIIAGEPFARHDILNGLAPEPYRIAFNEWLENRRIRLLEKASEVLSHFDNAARFEQLSIAFNKGATIRFVGAGLSAPSGFPTWTKFLYQLCDESHVSPNDLRALLNEGCYEGGLNCFTTIWVRRFSTKPSNQRSPLRGRLPALSISYHHCFRIRR
jgi:hypothetical protein